MVAGDMENTEHSGLLRASERGLSQALRKDEDKDSGIADNLLRQDRVSQQRSRQEEETSLP